MAFLAAGGAAAAGAAASSAAAAGTATAGAAAAAGMAATSAGGLAATYGLSASAIASSSTAIAGASAASAAAAGGGLFSGLFTSTNLMLASTALSTIGTLMSGRHQYNAALSDAAYAVPQLVDQADYTDLQASQEALAMQAEETEAALREEERQRRLNETLAQQTVLWGARGIDVNSGAAVTAADAAVEQAERETKIDRLFMGVNRTSSSLTQTGLSMRSTAMRAEAANSMRSIKARRNDHVYDAAFRAGGSLLDYAYTRSRI